MKRLARSCKMVYLHTHTHTSTDKWWYSRHPLWCQVLLQSTAAILFLFWQCHASIEEKEGLCSLNTRLRCLGCGQSHWYHLIDTTWLLTWRKNARVWQLESSWVAERGWWKLTTHYMELDEVSRSVEVEVIEIMVVLFNSFATSWTYPWTYHRTLSTSLMSRWVRWVCCQALRLASSKKKRKKRHDVNRIDYCELFSRVYILGIW